MGQAHRLARRTVVTMAVATGAVAANLYYAQPLADTIARAFGARTGSFGLVLTGIQVGFAVGLATLVPLGDLVERRRLLVTLLAVVVGAEGVMAAAPNLAVFAGAAAVVGLACVAVQVIVPFAAHLAAGERAGRVVSTVMSGLLIGILVSRTVSGLVAGALGWRAVFAGGALVTAVVAVLLWRELPVLDPTTDVRYPELLRSVLRLVRQEPVLRRRMVYGMASFSSFSVLWTSAGFLLARAPYHWEEAAIGAFALLGVAGAVAARIAGQLADRGLARPATGAFLLLTAASWVPLAVGGRHALPLAIGVVLLDFGSQGTHILNQSLVYPLRPEARSRLNTAYMVSFFVAGAVGSAASAALYARYGWGGVCVAGAAFPTAACVVWLAERVRQAGT